MITATTTSIKFICHGTFSLFATNKQIN